MGRDFDVIVVGGGGAGHAAAIRAAERGASVMILEADTRLGGATGYSTGVILAAGTATQRAKGIEDDADALYHYLMVLNEHAVRPAMMRHYADHSAALIDWLVGLGVEFPPEMLVESCVSGVERGHTCSSWGAGIAEALINRAAVLGVESAVATRVEGLIVEDGRVTGVRAGGTELRGGSVVVTTGGFGNNPAMLARLYPSAAYHGDLTWAVARDAKCNQGDGITLGEAIGANITGHDKGLIQLTPNLLPNVEAFVPPWLILVNREGRRFMNEYEAYTVTGYLVNEQTDRRAWAIFDDPTLVSESADQSYTDPYGSGLAISSWEEPTIRKAAAEGKVHSADNFADLAAKAGVDPAGLAETVRVFNADCARGEDRRFFKEAKDLHAIATPPFYAVEVRPSIIGLTGAGLDVDIDGAVLDTHGRAIPGLYAAGETVGCFHGKRYGGGGMSIGNALIFGQQAGASAAEAALGAAVSA